MAAPGGRGGGAGGAGGAGGGRSARRWFQPRESDIAAGRNGYCILEISFVYKILRAPQAVVIRHFQ
jgi:hypothetical protein